MAALADLLAQIRKKESGGNYNLTPQDNYAYPASHASGAYQIQPGTWAAWTKQSGIGTQYSQAWLAPPAVQDQVAAYALTKYGANSPGTWAASAPSGGYPSLTGDASLPAAQSATPTDVYNGALSSNTGGVGAFDFNGPNPAAAGGGAPLSDSSPGRISGSATSLPSFGATPAAVAANTSGGMGAGTVDPSGALSTVSAAGVPINITDAGKVASEAGAKLSGAIDQSTKSGIAAGTGWLSSITGAGTDWLVRGGLILLAIVFLAGAWVFYSADNKGATIIPIPV